MTIEVRGRRYNGATGLGGVPALDVLLFLTEEWAKGNNRNFLPRSNV